MAEETAHFMEVKQREKDREGLESQGSLHPVPW